MRYTVLSLADRVAVACLHFGPCTVSIASRSIEFPQSLYVKLEWTEHAVVITIFGAEAPSTGTKVPFPGFGTLQKGKNQLLLNLHMLSGSVVTQQEDCVADMTIATGRCTEYI